MVHSFILRDVIRRDVRNILWFWINRVDLRFSPFEFVIVTTLHFSKLTDIEMYVPRDVEDKIRDIYFKGRASLNHIDIETIFKARQLGDDDEDVVKLTMLCCLHIVLLRNYDQKKVDTQFL